MPCFNGFGSPPDRLFKSARRPLLAAVLLALAGATAGWADDKSLYILGLKAADFERWREALVLFDEAIKEEDEAGGLVRPYGTWFEPYVPHYYLGLAFYHLGEYADALETWEESERQGAICYPRSRKKWRNMARLRQQVPDLLQWELDRLSASIDRLRRKVDTLPAAAYALERSSPQASLEERLAEFEEEERRRDEELRQLLAEASPEQVRKVARVVKRRKKRLGELDQEAEGVVRKAAKQRQETRRRELLARYQAAVQLAEVGECRRAAVELRRLVHETAPDPLTPAEPLTPFLGLTRIQLACGRLEQAAVYLELARRRHGERTLRSRERTGEVPRGVQREIDQILQEIGDEIGEIGDLVAEARKQAAPLGAEPATIEPSAEEQAIHGYLTALGEIEVGGECQAVRDRIDGARRDLGDGPPPAYAAAFGATPYAPALATALAHRNCGDLGGTRKHLERARKLEAEVASEPIAALGEWLAKAEENAYAPSHALLVVSHEYQDLKGLGLKKLPGARRDIDVVRRALAAQGFKVEILANPTGDVLKSQIESFLRRRGKEGTRIVVYYAGHGWTRPKEEVQAGYLVPVDSPDPEKDFKAAEAKMLPIQRFGEYATYLDAQHGLFVFDTCFGGTVIERAGVKPLERYTRPDDPLNQQVRMFLTAGDDTETVPDFSIFRRTMTEALQGLADADRDGRVWGQELGAYVQQQVQQRSYTTPQFGRVEGLGRGDIRFRSLATGTENAPAAGEADLGGSSSDRLRVEIAYWQVVWQRNAAGAYRSYREVYPGGRFAALAELRLQRLGVAP